MSVTNQIKVGQIRRRVRDGRLFYVFSVEEYADGRTYVRFTPPDKRFSSWAHGAGRRADAEKRYELVYDEAP